MKKKFKSDRGYEIFVKILKLPSSPLPSIINDRSLTMTAALSVYCLPEFLLHMTMLKIFRKLEFQAGSPVMGQKPSVVRFQTSRAVLSHCFTDCMCARESKFFVQKCNQLQNNRINYEFS